MSKPEITVKQSNARKNELNGALINSSTSLSAEVMMSNAKGERWFLPMYRPVEQSAGGSREFAPSAADDGTLTFFVESLAPSGIAKEAAGAHAHLSGTSFCLVLNASGAGLRFPLNSKAEGGNIWRVSTKLAGAELKSARAALFDVSPNVSIEVMQTVAMATPLTQDFVGSNWSDATIRKGLLDTYGGIPYDSAAMFYMMAESAASDYSSGYMVLDYVNRTLVQAPPLPGYNEIPLIWKERLHKYYQDNQERSRVFYFPDKFELDKGSKGTPTASLLQFSLPEGNESDVGDTHATFRIYGRPVVDNERIQNAATLLKGKIGASPQMVSLQDAHHVKTTFTQTLPNEKATSSDHAVQKSADIDLSTGLRSELKLNFAQFRALWAAIFSPAPENALFRGWIDVSLSDGKYQNRIEFMGRLPAGQEAGFFDDIIDKSVWTTTYPAQFTVQTFENIFKGEYPKVLEIEVAFSGSKTHTLTEKSLVASVEIQRSIRDIVLGKQSPDEYPYKLRVVKEDGTITFCTGAEKSSSKKLYLTPKMIAACTGEYTE